MDDDICTIPDCGRPKVSRGWCAKHYQRWRKHGDANYEPSPSRARPGGGKPTIFVEVGQRIGRWIVVDPEARAYGDRRGARVRCTCPKGTEKVVSFPDLFSGNSKSCGCLRAELTSERNRGGNPAITHGMSGHPLFYTWKSMVSRCEYPSDKDWPRYGGRGIRVFGRWLDLPAFVADIEASIGPRPEGNHPSGTPLYTLNRIDNDGSYEPGNVEWATIEVQNRNRRNPPWRTCSCGGRSPAYAKFCCACGTILPATAAA